MRDRNPWGVNRLWRKQQGYICTEWNDVSEAHSESLARLRLVADRLSALSGEGAIDKSHRLALLSDGNSSSVSRKSYSGFVISTAGHYG